MKIRKFFLLLATGLCATMLVHAQEIKTQIAKPVESTVPAPGSKPALAPDIKPQLKVVALKEATVPDKTATTEPDENIIKPAVIPANNISPKNTTSTLAVEISNTVLPTPIKTNMSANATIAPVVTKEAKKTGPVIAEQQKQN